MKQISIFFCLLAAVLAAGCSSDDDETISTAAAQAGVQQMREALNGPLVVYAKCDFNGTDMTKLPGGCPLLLRFGWNADGTAMTVTLDDWSVGRMPVKLNYTGTATVGPLTTFDKQELSGDGWFAFSGTGHTTLSGMTSQEKDGSTISGYYNVATRHLRLTIDFNIMGVRLICPDQAIDPDRNLDKALSEYLEKLEEIKN